MRLSRIFMGSGRPDSNRRPSAWEADSGQFSDVRSGSHPSHGDQRSGRLAASTLSRLYPAVPYLMFGVCSAFLAGGWGSSSAYATQCAGHHGAARQACVAQARRDRAKYPRAPRWDEAMARMTKYEQDTLLRIGKCEMGTHSAPTRRVSKAYPPVDSQWATLRWGLDYSRYSTAFGIANVNGPYITATTGYAFPGRTPAEEVLGAIALKRGPARGFSGWGCF